MGQLNRAGLDFEACARCLEVLRLEWFKGSQLRLPIGLLFIYLTVIVTCHLVTVHSIEAAFVRVIVPVKHVCTIIVAGPFEVVTHLKALGPALECLVCNSWSAALGLSIGETAKVGIDVDQLFSESWR